jgi:hypothetical protein
MGNEEKKIETLLVEILMSSFCLWGIGLGKVDHLMKQLTQLVQGRKWSFYNKTWVGLPLVQDAFFLRKLEDCQHLWLLFILVPLISVLFLRASLRTQCHMSWKAASTWRAAVWALTVASWQEQTSLGKGPLVGTENWMGCFSLPGCFCRPVRRRFLCSFMLIASQVLRAGLRIYLHVLQKWQGLL